ncbi:unnamed protein product [Caenorhabditis nigoni]
MSDSTPTTKPEKVKAAKRSDHEDGASKKSMKRKSAASEDVSASKRAWLHEKAAESIIPTEEAAKVMPDRLFKGLDPLIVHMCVPCKKFNSARDAVEIADGMVQIPLALCTICRAHLVAQKNMKFFQHDCPSLKKMLNL